MDDYLEIVPIMRLDISDALSVWIPIKWTMQLSVLRERLAKNESERVSQAHLDRAASEEKETLMAEKNQMMVICPQEIPRLQKVREQQLLEDEQALMKVHEDWQRLVSENERVFATLLSETIADNLR